MVAACTDCSAEAVDGFRCANGFVMGGYPDGVPNCMKENGPGRAYWLFPPSQWEALRFAKDRNYD